MTFSSLHPVYSSESGAAVAADSTLTCAASSLTVQQHVAFAVMAAPEVPLLQVPSAVAPIIQLLVGLNVRGPSTLASAIIQQVRSLLI
jgi:hypothetical protein